MKTSQETSMKTNMKRLSILYYTVGLILLVFSSCQKELSHEGPAPLQSGNFTALVDGVQWVATDSSAVATIVGGMIDITGISSDNHQLSITLDDTITGTYPLNPNTASLAVYTNLDSSLVDAWSTGQGIDSQQAGGTVIVTQIDRVNKTLSGTFSFKVFRDLDNGQRVITQGVFFQIPYTNASQQGGSADTLNATIAGNAFVATNITGIGLSGQLGITGSVGSSGYPAVSFLIPENITPGPYTLNYNLGTTYLGFYQPNASSNLASASGTLTILSNDMVNSRIRADFQFQAKNPLTGQTFSLTNGFFSVQYTP